LLYVATWNGTSWALVGNGALNQHLNTSWAFHPSLVADSPSNSVFLRWIEQTALGQKAQVLVSKYSNGTWTSLGGSLNVDTVRGTAQRVSLAVSNSEPVVAWGEVSFGSLRNIYVKRWTGSNWNQVLGNGGGADTTAPTTPTNLAATAVSANEIDLTWSSSSDNGGVAGYYIYRGGSQIANIT
jgi:hypothetical protein